jgi:hypothetical protein
MNGVTGRMGYHQQLLRSVLAINADGGARLSDGRLVRSLVRGGFFGRILSVRGEFGYRVFEGDWRAPQRHVLEDTPFPYDLHAGARGVRVAEPGVRSSAEGRRVEVPRAGVPGVEVPA